ncbi:hypothetical protein VP468E531_P0077 [Vibrio phage 468E53-1]|nr:hypothetical protein VP468E531_P0077 [Vibrio phage 468E53-1]
MLEYGQRANEFDMVRLIEILKLPVYYLNFDT